MSDWIHVTTRPKEKGLYEVMYHEEFGDIGVESYSEMFWNGHSWHLLHEGKVGERAYFGNHQRQDIQDYWRVKS